MNLRDSEYTIKCIYCNIDLIDIFDKGTNKTNKLRVKCPKCGELTFYKKISETFGFNACNKLCVVNVTEQNNLYTIEVK